MAKSKAQKLRASLVREGKRDPEEMRSPFVYTDMRARMTKTKKDHLYQFKHKNHHSQDGNDGSFYLSFAIFTANTCFKQLKDGYNSIRDLPIKESV